jgi:hypothetical protein
VRDILFKSLLHRIEEAGHRDWPAWRIRGHARDLLPPRNDHVKLQRRQAVADLVRGTHGLRTERQACAKTSSRKAWGGSAAKAHEYSAESVGCSAKGRHVAGGAQGWKMMRSRV